MDLASHCTPDPQVPQQASQGVLSERRMNHAGLGKQSGPDAVSGTTRTASGPVLSAGRSGPLRLFLALPGIAYGLRLMDPGGIWPEGPLRSAQAGGLGKGAAMAFSA